MAIKRKSVTRVFTSLAGGDSEELTRKINEFLKDKTDASVTYHNVQGVEITTVFVTVTATPI
jgi:hypothetical protein